MIADPRKGERFVFGPGATSTPASTWIITSIRDGSVYAAYTDLWDAGAKRATHCWPIDWWRKEVAERWV